MVYYEALPSFTDDEDEEEDALPSLPEEEDILPSLPEEDENDEVDEVPQTTVDQEDFQTEEVPVIVTTLVQEDINPEALAPLETNEEAIEDEDSSPNQFTSVSDSFFR